MLRLALAVLIGILGWLPQGARAVTLPVLAATIDGSSVTSSLMSATWNIGIDNYIADLSANTASLSFKGTVTASPGDVVVISASGTTMWTGYVDTVSVLRDVAGDYWTTVSATDIIGRLGASELADYNMSGPNAMDVVAEDACSEAGLTLDFVDSSSRGLIPIYDGINDYLTYSGDLLSYINELAKASNAMLALQPDGTIKVYSRQALYSADVSNGTFDTNTTGWTATGTGASITRVTASPYEGAGNARIVSGTSLYGGATSSITGTFKKDHTYRMDFYARTISGSTSAITGFGDDGAGDFNNAVSVLTGSWAQYLVDWTPSGDRTAAGVRFLNTDGVSNTFEIDRVLIYEVVSAVNLGTTVGEWTTMTSVDIIINKWERGGTPPVRTSDTTSVSAYGLRFWKGSNFEQVRSGVGDDGTYGPFQGWIDYGGTLRDVVSSGELIVTDSASSLLGLSPFDWVNDGTQDWQVLGLSWSAAPGEPLRVTVTADDFIALL